MLPNHSQTLLNHFPSPLLTNFQKLKIIIIMIINNNNKGKREKNSTLRNYSGLDENIVWTPSWPFSILSLGCIWRTIINNPQVLPLFLYGLCFMLCCLAGKEGGLADKPNFCSCVDTIRDSKPQWKITNQPWTHFLLLLFFLLRNTHAQAKKSHVCQVGPNCPCVEWRKLVEL